MEHGKDILAGYVKSVLHAASSKGVPAEEILSIVGLDRRLLDDPEARIGHDVMSSVWEECARRTGDPDFGLHAGQLFVPQSYGVMGRVALTSPTVGGALERIKRYIGIVHTAIEIRFEVGEDAASFSFGLAVPPWILPRHWSESSLASEVMHIRRAVEEDIAPLEVRFQHPEPADTREHSRVFRAPVRFGCGRNELVLDRALLDRPTKAADPELCAAYEAEARDMLGRLGEADGLLTLLRKTIFDSLGSGDLVQAAIARKMGLTPGTLRRKLAARGMSYRELLGAMRRDLALAYLQDRKWSLTDVAFVLGFGDSLAFKRAFERWVGRSPADYRRALFEPGTRG
ncbi:MAG: AraC family transcriptional regulator [Deltaproteobacteria bacterium]|nr:AraC family transcriptional regulator [Deltaproteobacteria bacterium]